MKVYTLKTLFFTLAIACLNTMAYAQFDDVYYNPDDVNYNDNYDESGYDDGDDDVTYYDNDEYEYFDDYEYYYSSRIRRFHRPYTGFDFYDPCYISYNYYDPYYADAYYYPGSSIYISFGGSDYWSYRHWRRWQRWNRWNHYYAWNYYSPASYYYSYNSWCAPSYHYWGGHHHYSSYSNYYNNYYNSCPIPVSHYYGITNTTVTHINNGGTRGSYYGPRITGNTGSSPRGPVIKPESVQPVMKGNDSGVTQSNDRPASETVETSPVRKPLDVPSNVTRDDHTTSGVSDTRNGSSGISDGGKEITVDKELPRTATPSSKRPVFKPDTDNYKPYPSNERSGEKSNDSPGAQPSDQKGTSSTRETYQPRPSGNRENTRPSGEEQRPTYTPSREDNRPRYTPPSRENTEKPSYNPSRNEQERTESRPQYRPSERNDDRPSSSPSSRTNESSRSNERSGYSAPSRENSGGGSSRGSSSSGNDSSRSSSGGGGSSSPRSPGRG